MNKKISKWINKHFTKDISGKTVLITGANSGIGFEATKQFASLGANVIMACRNIEKAEKAKNEVLSENLCKNLTILQLDLADFESIKKFVEYIKINKIHIDILYNNAGVFGIPKSITKQNFEIIMGTNLLGTYLLNKELIEYFKEQGAETQIIFTTSITAHIFKIRYDDLFLEKHKYGKFKIYGSSKLGIIHVYNYFKEQCENSNLIITIVHPGITYTPLIDKAYSKNWFRKLARVGMRIMFHKADKAALTAVLAVNENKNGLYVGPRGLFGISGYPKTKKVPRRLCKGTSKTIELLNKYCN